MKKPFKAQFSCAATIVDGQISQLSTDEDHNIVFINDNKNDLVLYDDEGHEHRIEEETIARLSKEFNGQAIDLYFTRTDNCIAVGATPEDAYEHGQNVAQFSRGSEIFEGLSYSRQADRKIKQAQPARQKQDNPRPQTYYDAGYGVA